jgi:hypothetical protein
LNSRSCQDGSERRKERREAAEGEVIFQLEGSTGQRFRARLLDVSPHGFRAEHSVLTLPVGTELNFEHPGRSGKAVVVWNLIVGAGVQTGLFVTEAQGSKPAG